MSIVARTPPPAFLFPNQRCQRPEPPWRPHRLAPGVGGGGYLVAPYFRVNRTFEAFFRSRPWGETRKKNPPGRPRGFPQKVQTDSTELRNLIEALQKCKAEVRPRLSETLSRFRRRPARFRAAGGVYPLRLELQASF